MTINDLICQVQCLEYEFYWAIIGLFIMIWLSGRIWIYFLDKNNPPSAEKYSDISILKRALFPVFFGFIIMGFPVACYIKYIYLHEDSYLEYWYVFLIWLIFILIPIWSPWLDKKYEQRRNTKK